MPEETTADNITTSVSREHDVSEKQSGTTKSTEKEATSKRAKTDNKNYSTATASATDKTTAKQTTTKKAENKTTTKKPAKTTVTTTSSSVTCSIEIECKQILNNMDKLKAGHEDFVPDNGIIMSTHTVTVDNGDTVYDVLKSACTNNGVTINSQKSVYGTYIKGLNNIDEFDCGKQSGWVYTVNGSSPPKSCDKYIVSQGDSIVFSFVC